MSNSAIKLTSPLETWLEDFKSTLEVLLDAYCIVDISGRVVDFNLAFSDLVGESHRKILKTGSLADLIRFTSDINPGLQAITSEKVLRIDEVVGSTRACPQLKLIIGAVPIFSKNKGVLGALIVFRNVTAESDLQSKYDEKKKDSVTDGLTALFNKVHIEEIISKAVKHCLRDSKPISIVMCDIDHFKKVNDTHGHQAGDYVLKLVANTLKGMMRETDQAGRFGGEEFIVLLNNCPEPGAEIFAERLRKTIETTSFIFEGKRIPITISQGTATLNTVWSDGLDPDQIKSDVIHQADNALYEAKKQGRNRVIQFKKN